MEVWIVIIINMIIGLIISSYNVLLAVPIVLIGLTFGLVLILFKKIFEGGNK